MIDTTHRNIGYRVCGDSMPVCISVRSGLESKFSSEGDREQAGGGEGGVVGIHQNVNVQSRQGQQAAAAPAAGCWLFMYKCTHAAGKLNSLWTAFRKN